MKITEPTSCAIRGRSDGGWHESDHEQRLEIGGGISHSITTITKDNLLMEQQVQNIPPKPELPGNWIWNAERQKWVRYRIRKLTPKECFRLMGMKDKYIDIIKSTGISESRQYQLAGNSIVVNVLFYIYKNLFIENEKPSDTLF